METKIVFGEKMNCLLIVNPVAGKMKIKKDLPALISVLNAHGYEVKTEYTKPDVSAGQTVSENAEAVSLLVCCGGDGTLNEVLSGLIKLEKENRPPVLYYPCGSTNDFAKTMRLPSTVKGVSAALDGMNTLPLDVGDINGRTFSYIASYGIFTKASYSASRKMKNIFGHFAYVLKGMTEIGTLGKSYHTKITYEGGTVDGDYILAGITNSTSAGGVLRLDETEVSLSDGVFEILLVKGLDNVKTAGKIVSMLLKQKHDGENVILLHTKKATFECDEAPVWTLDGECGGAISKAEITCIPSAVEIIR